ncbi:hypothetical protein TDB9533_03454 [Thalassocella blandensis]|nr:hypothetical protein TDB9533_03454 [Thalassocella blandensis]
MDSITQIVKAVDNANEEAIDRLIELAYERLHTSAKKALGQSGHASTLQATELVNELYLFFKQRDEFKYNDSAHFFATAAIKLRQILLDRYRKNSAKKRDFGEKVDTVQMHNLAVDPPMMETLVVNGYIDQIEKIDPVTARIVDLLIFWEFSFAEVAEILGVGERTVYRKWKWAITWLSTRT